MNNEELQYYKERLEAELKETESHLKTVARRNPDNPDDWQPIPEDMNPGTADKNEFADSIEDFEENSAITKRLEIRYNNIREALEKIDSGNYGYCEVGGEKHLIEKEKLEANPSTKTCIEHKDL